MLNPVACTISDHYFDLLSKKYAIKKLFFYRQVSVHEAGFSRIQIMTPRATTRGTFWVAVVKNCAIFYKLYIKWFQILETFYSSVTLIILATAKCTMNQWNDARDKCKYRRKWGKFGPSYLLNKNGDLFFLLYFSKQILKGNS